MKLKDLPEPYRERAERRIEEATEPQGGHAFFGAASGDYQFLWDDTPEGRYFWGEVVEAKSEIQLPYLPDVKE